jgi:predicted  nucleic acid-binding Zn-ribbon protein
MKVIKYLIALLILASATITSAQPPPPMGPEGGPMREKVRERIHTMKIWKLTEEVGLTSEQSEKFFPVYNKFQNALEDIESKRADLVDRLEQLTNASGSSDKEISDAMAALNDIPKQMLAERDKFQKDISDILPLQQQAKLAVFEERFKQRLQEFIRDIRQQYKGRGLGDN